MGNERMRQRKNETLDGLFTYNRYELFCTSKEECGMAKFCWVSFRKRWLCEDVDMNDHKFISRA